jgi:transposase
MSVQSRPWPEPAKEIVSAVRAKYARRRAPLAVQIRDQLGELFPDVEFEQAFGDRGRPGWSPGRLALVTVLQMAEDLTDRQATEAVRERLSWQYALGLELDDPGFDHTVLSEFRARVVAHGLQERVLDLLLEALKGRGLVKAGGKQRTDSTHVICAVRDLNRLELAGESVRACLEALAVAAPDWLAAGFELSGWGGRYRARVDSWRLPTSETKRKDLALAYAHDGYALVAACYAAGAPAWLRELPAVQVLRTVLVQNYITYTDRQGREVIRRREVDTDGLPPGRLRVTSPYDTDARWAAKGDDLHWNGYKVHVSETCDGPEPDASGDMADTRPNIITNVSTTDATVPDAKMTAPIHDALAAKGLLPGEHYVDSGYPSAALVVDSLRKYRIVLVSPLLADHSRQAKAAAGYDRASFTIDFGNQQATCPQGQSSSWWSPASQRGTDAIVIKFAASTCRLCPVRDQCTRSTSPRYGRQLTVPPAEVHQAQLSARAAQNTKDWQARYAIRAGVEGTIRQGVAACGMRRARYRGLPKTRLEHVYSAVALNLIRLDAHWNDHPLDRTRTSHLARLELTLAA